MPPAEVLADAHAGLEREGPGAVGDASIWPVHAVALLLWCDELECAEAELEALLERARRRRAPLQVANLLFHRAWPAYWRGRVDEALSDAQRRWTPGMASGAVSWGSRSTGWRLPISSAESWRRCWRGCRR
jgi:hypothetical protein